MKNNDYSDMFEPRHNAFGKEEEQLDTFTKVLIILLSLGIIIGLVIYKITWMN